ncbi:transposon Tf2-3 polyprotein [Batrachochytrium salamandrivorans]|nr:transposon Tf2-3 polyprotein [Batrachochytrium salamandrivorans]
MVEFDSPYCLENCSDGSSRIQGLGKPPDTSKIFELPLAPDSISTPVDLSPISCSLSDSISLESMQADVYPFVEVSPVSDASVPPDILSSFSSLFSEDQAETLPPYRDFDCSIDLKPGSEPFHGKIYQLTREEDKVMQEWIKDNLRKGFIRNSSSPHGAPCFFVKQKDKLRLCMDYRGLNKNTVKDRNPIPLISELLRTLVHWQDLYLPWTLRGAYNLFASRKETSPRLHSSRKYGQFEFLVMPFGLANAPAQFQRMMNSLFRDVIGKHVLVYLDDIVIYSDNMSDHIAQVHNVLRVLQDNGLYCKAEKCHFYKSEIKYLGYIISADGLRMDPSKISAVQSWPTPKKVRDLQVLLGFTNFYRALIHDYSSMTANLTKLFKKDAPFVWGPEQEKSLQDLKTAFANSDFLTHPDDSRPFIWRPMHRIMPYPVYSAKFRVLHDDQEVNSSSGSLVSGVVLSTTSRSLTDLANLMVGPIHFPVVRTTSQIPSLQTSSESWILQKVVDLQSLVADMDLHLLLHSQVLEKVFVLESDWPLIIADFLAGEDNVWMDDVPEVILERCKRELKHFRFRDNSFLRILEDGKSTAAYVTTDKRVDVMKHYHTSLAHLKYGSIIDLLLRRFWWPSMKKDLKDFIARCPECQLDRSSSGIHAPLPIRPVPPVALPFEQWGIDFYGPMAETKSGNKYLITCIDYATRWVLAKPVKDMTESAVSAFLYELMMTYGAPFEIISDRGKSFLAEGIDLFERENKIRHLATTPYHPQTNGMVERMHAMLGHGLTTLVHGKRDRWDEYLPQVLLALRTRTHAVTGYSPFFLLFGIHPRLPTDETPPRNTLAPLDEIERMEENSEFIARNLEEVGQARSAANVRTKAQAEAMRKA